MRMATVWANSFCSMASPSSIARFGPPIPRAAIQRLSVIGIDSWIESVVMAPRFDRVG